MNSEKLPKAERVHSERRIGVLFNEGRRGGAGPLKYCWLETAAADLASQSVSQTGSLSVPLRESSFSSPPLSAMFSVPKKAFKKAWKRNLIKRRLRESYRKRKGELAEKLASAGRHIDIAFICTGPPVEKRSKKASRTPQPSVEIPDFKTLDNAVAKILEQILAHY